MSGQLSPTKRRLLDVASLMDTATGKEIGYQHSLLCQTALPYRQPPPGLRSWERSNGNAHLRIEAGKAWEPVSGQWVELPLPFGPKSRLVLIYLNSEAVRTGSPVIEVGDSMTDFLRRLIQRDPNTRDIQALKGQLSALSVATIRLAAQAESRSMQMNTQFVEQFDLWFPKDARQRVLWPSTIELSQRYFESLEKHAVPLDQRAVAALAHSAMALDIYTWLAQRLHRIPVGKPQFVSWAALYGQFGQGFGRMVDFRRKFLEALRQVKAAYPAAQIREEISDRTRQPEGLSLRNSPAPILKRMVTISGQ